MDLSFETISKMVRQGIGEHIKIEEKSNEEALDFSISRNVSSSESPNSDSDDNQYQDISKFLETTVTTAENTEGNLALKAINDTILSRKSTYLQNLHNDEEEAFARTVIREMMVRQKKSCSDDENSTDDKDVKPLFKCDACDSVFSHWQSLKSHKATHSTTKFQLNSIDNQFVDVVNRGRMVGMWQCGRSDTQIATALGCCHKTVHTWLKRWKKDGHEGLKTKLRSGRPTKYQKIT